MLVMVSGQVLPGEGVVEADGDAVVPREGVPASGTLLL
jgi:hypothetical protein